MIYKSDSTF